jgi:hypothetical protein
LAREFEGKRQLGISGRKRDIANKMDFKENGLFYVD